MRLIDGKTDAYLWSGRFDREYRSILALHSDVARAIAQEMNVALTREEAASLTRAPVVNPEAYGFFLRGNEYHWRNILERDIRMSIQMYEKAIELDPDFAPAHAALSEAHARMWWFYHDRTPERVARAKAAADRARLLGPDLSETHRALGCYYYFCRLDYDRALQELDIAGATKPNDSLILATIGSVLRRQGKMEQSLSAFKRAFALDPRSAEVAQNTAGTCALMRNGEEAAHYYDLAIGLDPDYAIPYAYAAVRHLRLTGDTFRARSLIETAQRVVRGNDVPVAYARAVLSLYDGSYSEEIARLSAESWEVFETHLDFVPKTLLQAQIYGLMEKPELKRSHYESTRKMLETRIRERPDEAMYHSTLGMVYAELGRKEDALREGQAGVDLMPLSQDAYRGFDRLEDLARIHATVGEHEEAITRLEYLMSIPGNLGVGALRLDPVWKLLHDHPRFQALVRKHSK